MVDKATSKGQVVIGKFPERPSSSTTYEDNYIEDVVPLEEEEIEQTKEYGLTYEAPKDQEEEPQLKNQMKKVYQ